MSQRWDATSYGRDAAFVADLADDVLALLDPQRSERILDLGCGDGRLTARIAGTGARVTGIDASETLLARASALGLDMRRLDGHALDYDRDFDAVFSNAALHWMTRPDAVLAGVARALRPGGRFVGEFGGFGNVAAIRTALAAAAQSHGIAVDWSAVWYFPDPDAYAARLEAAGFRIETLTLVPRLTRLDAGMEAWLLVFGDWLLAPLSRDTRAALIEEATSLLAPILTDSRGRWHADYVRLRFRATRP